MRGQKDLKTVKKEVHKIEIQLENLAKLLQNSHMTDFDEKLCQV